MKLRYRIVYMALDIEHYTKLQLLRMMDKFNEDGYQMYQKNWTLDIQNMSWVEDINRQVDFLIKQLHLKGTEKYLILHVDLVGTHWSLPDVGMMLPVLILHRRT